MTYTLQAHYPLPFLGNGHARPFAVGKAVSAIVFVLLLLAMASTDGCPLDPPPPPPPPPDYPWPEPKGKQSGPWGQNGVALIQEGSYGEETDNSQEECPHRGHPGRMSGTQEEEARSRIAESRGLMAVAVVILTLMAVLGGGGKTSAGQVAAPASDPILHEYGKNPWKV
jgi:hypothetical protein